MSEEARQYLDWEAVGKTLSVTRRMFKVIASARLNRFFGPRLPSQYRKTMSPNGTAFTQDDHNLEMADTIDGLAQKNARMWQIIALVSLSSFFVALGVLIYAVTLPKTVPVVVTVNPEGEAAYVGRIDKLYAIAKTVFQDASVSSQETPAVSL